MRLIIFLLFFSCFAYAETAKETKPTQIPVASYTDVTLQNWPLPPYNRWALRNMGILHTLMIPRAGDVFEIPRAKQQDLSSLQFEHRGKRYSVAQSLAADQTDGIVVLKGGEIVWEAYYDGFGPHDHHLWASSTKSLIGMAAGILVERGQIDLEKKISDYLPELKSSAWSRASVQDTLNMSTAIDYQEAMISSQPGSIAFEYFKRIGLLPAFDLMMLKQDSDQTPRSVRPLLQRFQANTELPTAHIFQYQSPNVDVIGWLIERVSGKSLKAFITEEIWSKLGAEHDAFITADSGFVPVATGGMNTTLRDFARFGVAIMNDGKVAGQQVFPQSSVQAITEISAQNKQGVKRSVYRQATSRFYDSELQGYKNFWWVHDEKGVFTARGIYGQILYIDKPKDILIATFASAKTPSNAARETAKRRMQAFKAIAEQL
ncbi:serine hydrolase [uncultured Pseudoteredinibacter sp.]|uniref:serine hydrolase domain-containing protein n=1 Tax=uncultured Pseudoteredinibacter sp. TaxID=1641701 RepID=UPI002612EE24|nr:serine hydrolase [uncultured Pseudoteredinibacter sp.]